MSGYSRLLAFLNLCSFVNGFTVSVTCTIDTMQIFVGFDERFHGRLILRPSTDCFLDGQGRRLLLFSISLQAALTERCSIMQLDNEYVGIMEVQMNRNLIVAADSQFLVKCPTHNQPPPNLQLGLNKRSNAPIRSEMSLISPSTLSPQTLEPLLAQIGNTYSWNLIFYNEVGLPSIRVGQCLAFLAKGKLDVVELTDTNGCAKSAQLSHDFRWASNWQMLQTELEMFNATANNHFYLQCQMRRCADECQPVVCDPRLNDATINQNSYFLVSIRVDILVGASSLSLQPNSTTSGKCLKGFCPEINLYLIGGLILSVCALTAVSWIVICWLRPKCLSMKAVVQRYRKQESSSTSSQSSEVNTLNRLIGQINNSKRNSTLNVDELIRENFELKMCTLMQLSSGANSSPSTSINNPTHSTNSFLSHPNNPDQFVSLDALPEPPSVSIEEIRELNRAFNTVENDRDEHKFSSKSPSSNSGRSNSFDSLASASSNTTLDYGKRPTSSCSTVDVKTDNPLCYKTQTRSATTNARLQITSLKTLTQRPKLSPTLDLKQADQSLGALLEQLRAKAEQKRVEATQLSNDWLKFLKMDE